MEIRGLSSFIDTHSVRVSGLGSAARLLDVACTIATSKSAFYLPDSSTEVIRKLSVRKNTLEKERTLRNNESQLLLAYAETLNGEHVNPQQMTAFLEGFMQQGKKIIQAVILISLCFLLRVDAYENFPSFAVVNFFFRKLL